MNKITESIFKNLKPNFEKLQNYGFGRTGDGYFYCVEIMDGQFALNVKITDADIVTQLIDRAVGEPYTLFLAEGAGGTFVGAVRSAYENVLNDIAQKCYEKCVFKSEYAQKIIGYVQKTYGDGLEFLWEKFSDNAIWRRKDNKKWYAVLLTVRKDKLGLPSDERVEILDLRAEPEYIEKHVDGKTFFGGYHMNKKHWLTVMLDGSVPLEEIKNMLDASYGLARKG